MICNRRQDVPADLSWNLEAYSIGERVFTVPEGRKKVEAKDLFRNSFIPQDRRWTMVMTVLYSTNVQYGLAMFEMGFDYFRYLEYLTYQLSAAVKIQELIRTQNETLMQLNKINIALHNMSSLDQLTGALNRRGFYSEAAKQFEQMTDRLIVLFVDLDGLKMINDNFGHNTGDEVLIKTAELIKENFPDSVIARLGGDEFAVINESFSQDEITEKTCKLETAVADEFRRYGCGTVLSIGITYAEGTVNDIDKLIQQSDRRMYEIKKLHHESFLC